jgi:hypothetical protein
MPGDESFFPPVQYSPLWFLLGVGIFVAIVIWYVAVIWFTRKRALPPPPPAPFSLPLPDEARNRYLGFIDDVNAGYRRGTLSYSDAHHELSVIIRAFAAEARGVRAPYMTLQDLRDGDHTALADIVEKLYPGEFSGRQENPIEVAVSRAKGLVSTWR